MKNLKKELHPEFKKYAELFYKKNGNFIIELKNRYQELTTKLKTQLDFEHPCELKFEELITIENKELKKAITDIGFNFYDLKSAVRKKVVSEYLVHNKGMSVHFLALCEQVQDFFYIKDAIINLDNFLNPIHQYKEGKLNEDGKRKLYLQIKSYQDNFNNHHLKKYALRLFGISYKEIVKIKQECFEETYNSYANIFISKEGTVYTKKDGTIAS